MVCGIKRNALRHVLHSSQAKNFLLRAGRAGLSDTGPSRLVVGQGTPNSAPFGQQFPIPRIQKRSLLASDSLLFRSENC